MTTMAARMVMRMIRLCWWWLRRQHGSLWQREAETISSKSRLCLFLAFPQQGAKEMWNVLLELLETLFVSLKILVTAGPGSFLCIWQLEQQNSKKSVSRSLSKTTHYNHEHGFLKNNLLLRSNRPIVLWIFFSLLSVFLASINQSASTTLTSTL